MKWWTPWLLDAEILVFFFNVEFQASFFTILFHLRQGEFIYLIAIFVYFSSDTQKMSLKGVKNL